MREKIINIERLAHPCITRERGKEAALKLLKHINNDRVVIDLNNVEMISFSFLDELVFWLAGSANMRNIIFRLDDQIVHDKLARIVAIRKVLLYYQTGNQMPQLLKPKEFKPYESQFMPTKGL